VGKEIGDTQGMEGYSFDVSASQPSQSTYHELVVRLPDGRDTVIPTNLRGFSGCDPIQVSELNDSTREREAQDCANEYGAAPFSVRDQTIERMDTRHVR
jgi:hypothetical protein